MIEWFDKHADESLKSKVKRPVLLHIITEYWKKTRNEQKWHVFNRKFWENPDYNESDLMAAFRKRT